MPGKYWVIQHTPTIHNLPLSLQPAKCLLHHPPCADQAIIEAAPVGRLTNLVALDTGRLQRKGWISHSKRLHTHSFSSPGWMCKPLTTSNVLTHHTILIRVRIANRTWSTSINVCEITSCIHTCQYNDGSELLVAEVCIPRISWLLDGHERTIQGSTPTWQPTQSFKVHHITWSSSHTVGKRMASGTSLSRRIAMLSCAMATTVDLAASSE